MTATASARAAQETKPLLSKRAYKPVLPIISKVDHGLHLQTPPRLTAEQALAIARERFSNLCCGGILPRRAVGNPVDLADVDVALLFLSQCRRTTVPKHHSFDLRRAIPGDVQLGAVICAAVALGFDVRSWYGNVEFGVHALIGVNANDVKRVKSAALIVFQFRLTICESAVS